MCLINIFMKRTIIVKQHHLMQIYYIHTPQED